MPIQMNEEDRNDFERRLAKYGLTASSVLAEELVTVPSSVTPLHAGPNTEGVFRPITLRTSNIDQLNRWIGVPDVLFDRIRPTIEIPTDFSVVLL
jgi:hypothetical protein